MRNSNSSSGSFDDGKAPGAMRTIGEVSAALDIKPHVLRYWEERFPMLNPLKRSGGRRLYRTDDIVLLGQIDQLVNREGFTIKGAAQVLKGGKAKASASQAAGGNLALMAGLQGVRNRLEQALNA